MTNWYQRVVVPRLLNSEMGSEKFETVRREVLSDASGVVLELGVGPGYNLSLYRNISKLYVLEPSQELIDIAKSRSGSLVFPVEFLRSGAEHIPLPDHSVDTVVSTWTMCSVSDPRKVLSEIRRVLTRGGKFIFADHGASPNRLTRIVQTVSTSVTKHFTGNCHYNRQLERLMREAGFSIERMRNSTERLQPLMYNYQGIATTI